LPGPLPKPTHLKVLTGNPGNRPLPENEPEPAKGEPKMPSWLKGRARAAWKEMVPELARIGLLTIVDGHALAVYCEAWATYVEASEIVRAEGILIESYRGGKAKNPAAQIMRDSADLMMKVGGQYGLTPATRARLQVPDDGKDDFDLNALLG
jgi:P27 family predicted phage terminase small subunit